MNYKGDFFLCWKKIKSGTFFLSLCVLPAVQEFSILGNRKESHTPEDEQKPQWCISTHWPFPDTISLFCWWYSKSKHIPRWFSGLLLLAETYSQTCCQFSCRLGGSVFRDCLVSYDLKSGTPCFLPWVSVPASGTGSCWLTDWPNRCSFKWENQGFLQIIKVLVAVFY